MPASGHSGLGGQDPCVIEIFINDGASVKCANFGSGEFDYAIFVAKGQEEERRD